MYELWDSDIINMNDKGLGCIWKMVLHQRNSINNTRFQPISQTTERSKKCLLVKISQKKKKKKKSAQRIISGIEQTAFRGKKTKLNNKKKFLHSYRKRLSWSASLSEAFLINKSMVCFGASAAAAAAEGCNLQPGPKNKVTLRAKQSLKRKVVLSIERVELRSPSLDTFQCSHEEKKRREGDYHW